jgi:hypothetical protein
MLNLREVSSCCPTVEMLPVSTNDELWCTVKLTPETDAEKQSWTREKEKTDCSPSAGWHHDCPVDLPDFPRMAYRMVSDGEAGGMTR